VFKYKNNKYDQIHVLLEYLVYAKALCCSNIFGLYLFELMAEALNICIQMLHILYD